MIEQFDIMIMEWINQFHNPILDGLMILFSYVGNLGIVWLVISLLLMIYRQKKAALGTVLAIAISALLSELIFKNLINRPRPFVENEHLVPLVHKPTSSSFPSSHTTSSFAAASFLFKRDIKKWLMLVLAFLISFSRIYVNVHHPSDVIVGMILGIVMGIGVDRLVKYIYIKYISENDEDY